MASARVRTTGGRRVSSREARKALDRRLGIAAVRVLQRAARQHRRAAQHVVAHGLRRPPLQRVPDGSASICRSSHRATGPADQEEDPRDVVDATGLARHGDDVGA